MTETHDKFDDDRCENSPAAEEEPADKPGKKERRAGTATARVLKDKLKKAEEDIAQLSEDLKDLNDRHLRRLAEIENLRKRHDKEKADYLQFALSDFIHDHLAILDNFERALDTANEDSGKQSFREGVELIYRMYCRLLEKQGVRPVTIADGRFDPEFHHAMSMEESDMIEEPVVAEELQKGYLLHERLLRPALVKVLVPKKG